MVPSPCTRVWCVPVLGPQNDNLSYPNLLLHSFHTCPLLVAGYENIGTFPVPKTSSRNVERKYRRTSFPNIYGGTRIICRSNHRNVNPKWLWNFVVCIHTALCPSVSGWRRRPAKNLVGDWLIGLDLQWALFGSKQHVKLHEPTTTSHTRFFGKWNAFRNLKERDEAIYPSCFIVYKNIVPRTLCSGN